MPFQPCFNHVLLVAVVSCLRMTDTIVVFSVWASNTLKMHSWMTNVPVVGIWAWFRCDLAFPFWKDWHPLLPPVLISLCWRTAPLWQTPAELRAGQHRTHSQDSTLSALSQFFPVCWVIGKWAGRTGRCHACCAISPHPGIRAPFFSSSSVPRTVNPGGIFQAPPAVRLGGAVWRQPQYWC